jgi:hypothetical protein
MVIPVILPGLAVFFADCGRAGSGPAQPAPDDPARGATREKSSWAEVVAWTDSWDVRDATTYEEDGAAWSKPPATRVESVADRGPKPRPLKRDSGAWSKNLRVPPIPGPKYLRACRRFNGRPAMLTDYLGPRGVFGRVCAMLSPVANPLDPAMWFNPPHGYDAPYWCAILCRAPEELTQWFGAWDANNGHMGTAATIGAGIARGKTNPYWGVTTSVGLGDPWPATKVEGSADQTILVIVKVDDANSFMELTWRDASGKIVTDRTNFRLKSYTAKEIFFGYVHSSYLTVAGLKVGSPTEAELQAVRDWSAPWIPPMGKLPVEP